MSTGTLTRRCNPYGHATDAGPKHLLGGAFSSAHEGDIKWNCENPAAWRGRMHCTRIDTHVGPVMELCADHVQEIQRRQAGFCTRCGIPPVARGCMEAIEHIQQEIAAMSGGIVAGARMRELERQLAGYQDQMTHLFHTGQIRVTPMRLVEVS